MRMVGQQREQTHARGEDGKPPRVRAIESALDEFLDPVEVAGHGVVPVRLRPCTAEQDGDLALEVLVAEIAAAVDVEVTGRDRCLLAAERCQLSDHVCGDDGHGRLLVSDGVGKHPPIVVRCRHL